MSLESILNHIITEARLAAEDILQKAKLEAEDILQKAKLEAEDIYRQGMEREKGVFEKRKQKLIVQERLAARQKILQAKQELIDEVFRELKPGLGKNKLKKQQVAYDKIHEEAEDVDFYLHRIRADYEAEIARILFA